MRLYALTTPGPSTVFTTTPIEVDALIRNLGDTDFVGEHIYNRAGTFYPLGRAQQRLGLMEFGRMGWSSGAMTRGERGRIA